MALVECEVIGDLPIVDARDGGDRTKGQTVVLDDERTVIGILLDAGLVGPPKPWQETKTPAKGEAPGTTADGGEA